MKWITVLKESPFPPDRQLMLNQVTKDIFRGYMRTSLFFCIRSLDSSFVSFSSLLFFRLSSSSPPKDDGLLAVVSSKLTGATWNGLFELIDIKDVVKQALSKKDFLHFLHFFSLLLSLPFLFSLLLLTSLSSSSSPFFSICRKKWAQSAECERDGSPREGPRPNRMWKYWCSVDQFRPRGCRQWRGPASDLEHHRLGSLLMKRLSSLLYYYSDWQTNIPQQAQSCILRDCTTSTMTSLRQYRWIPSTGGPSWPQVGMPASSCGISTMKRGVPIHQSLPSWVTTDLFLMWNGAPSPPRSLPPPRRMPPSRSGKPPAKSPPSPSNPRSLTTTWPRWPGATRMRITWQRGPLVGRCFIMILEIPRVPWAPLSSSPGRQSFLSSFHPKRLPGTCWPWPRTILAWPWSTWQNRLQCLSFSVFPFSFLFRSPYSLSLFPCSTKSYESKNHTDHVRSVCWSSKGNILFSAGWDGNVLAHNVE